MWSTQASRETNATKEQIWQLWSDVPNWKDWDSEVESSEIFGEFQTGTKGLLKPVAGPKAKFLMTECTQNLSFTNRSNLPLCKMDFIHKMEETKDGLEVTHEVVMTGPLTFFFSRVIGSKIKDGLAQALDNLTELAETK